MSSFDNFIIKNQLNLSKDDWEDISEKYELSVDMLRLFQNKLDWRKLSKYQHLSIPIIEEFIDYQLSEYIDVICKYQKLNEEFISKYKHKVNWNLVLAHQSLSIEFIIKHSQDITKYREENWEE